MLTVRAEHIKGFGDVLKAKLHGSYDDGFEMEIAIADRGLEDYDLLERLIIKDNELSIMKEPFRPGKHDESDALIGHPTTDGYYWALIPSVSSKPIHVLVLSGLVYIHGIKDARDVEDIVKYKPDPIPTM